MERLEKRLSKIYESIPPLANCNMCGKCCVNVNMTMLEYIYMFKGLTARYNQAELLEIMQQPLIDNIYVTDNKCCRFLSNNGHCMAYLERAYSCRAGGNSSLDAIYTKNCFHKSAHKEKPPFTLTQYWNTLLRLEKMDDVLRGFKSKLFISRLALESWTSIYLCDEDFDKEITLISNILKRELDLDFLKGKYNDIADFPTRVKNVIAGKNALENNDYGKALRHFTKNIETNFDGFYHDESFYYSGICCEKLGRDLDSINCYLKVSKFHPFYTSAMENMQSISIKLSRAYTDTHLSAISG